MIRKIAISVFTLALSITLWGQQQDLRSWYTIGLETELFNLIDVSLVPEVRLWDNSSRFEGFLAEADVSAPVLKLFRFGLNYRYQADFEKPDRTRQTNRYGIYGEVSHKLAGFKFTYRALYHREYTDMKSSELGYIPLAQHRHKITVRYKTKDWKISPAVSAEMFYTLSPEWAAYEEKLRLSGGIKYEITKFLEAEIGYKYQQEFYESNPLTSHILCAGLTMTIK